jgi:phospholipid/cholesterol/gamma-HCH transport system permease protein
MRAPDPLGREGAPRVALDGGVARFSGCWTIGRVGGVERELARLEWPRDRPLILDASRVTALDTAGAWLLESTRRALARSRHEVSVAGLRPDHEALVAMIRARVADRAESVRARSKGALARVGELAARSIRQLLGILGIVGESAFAATAVLRHPRRLRWRPVLHNIESAGFRALPITGLLSFLMGVVIAYQGATQLERYGANIFVADLVGLAMLRELSPLLTAIIVAGRSGSAYAAQIGTMKVTEEIDALRTVGIAPFDLLVLPKLIALTIALPLLVVYADALAVMGGMMMAKTSLGVGYADFLDRFEHAIDLPDYLVGIGKAPVFAAIIAVVGCYQGFQVSGDAESVGRQTTVSVVQSIFLVIVADAAFSVAFSYLGI